jgi:cytochrome c553
MSSVLVALAATSIGCAGGDTAPAAYDEAVPPPGPYARPAYTRLSETGLYASTSLDELGRGVVPFAPSYPLWSDGAEKRRWVALPENARIDTTDMDHWVLPVGTRLWKEFSLGGVRLETRLIERHGEGPDDYFFGSFVWSADQSDAVLTEGGLSDVAGTAHDVPAIGECHACHDGEAGRVLGFSALQLASDSNDELGTRLAELVASDRLSEPPKAKAHYVPPGDPTTRAAFGYLHANCGHCHNPAGYCNYPGMELRLKVGETVPELTELWRTVVGRDAMFRETAAKRVAPGAPSESAIIERMSTRGGKGMPILGTELVDQAGIAAVSAWISALPE